MSLVLSGDSPNLVNPTISGAVVSSMASSVITSGTAVASTSGASIDFTSIPSWAKKITVMFNGVSTSGTSALQIQIGDAGGFETSGYASSAQAGGTSNALTSGFSIAYAGFTATYTSTGVFVINLIGSNTWVEFGNLYNFGTGTVSASAGSKTLSDTLTQVRITTVNGTDTFDAGSINILYE